MNSVHAPTVGIVAHIYLQASPTLMNWTTAFGHSTGQRRTLGRTLSDMAHVDILPPPRAGGHAGVHVARYYQIVECAETCSWPSKVMDVVPTIWSQDLRSITLYIAGFN